MTRVLVTGATGFTARYVIPLLEARGDTVLRLSTRNCDVRNAADLREAVASARPQQVLHLAGTPNLDDSQADLAQAVNVQGTINLLAACEALPEPPRRIIVASSCYVYGDTGHAPAHERAPLRPRGAYGRSKLDMEQAAARWAERLPIVIVRPFNYTGVGHDERFLVPKLVRAFRSDTPDVSFVYPGVVRDFSDVRWVAAVYAALLGAGKVTGVLNVCSGKSMSLEQLIEMLAEMTGRRPRRPIAAPASDQVSRLVGSPARLAAAGIPFSPYSLTDTLRWMVDAR